MKLLSLTLSVLVIASVARADELSGQVFIVTNAHQSVKLGLVAVALFDQDEVQAAMDAVRQKTLPELQRMQKMIVPLQQFEDSSGKAADLIMNEYVRGKSTIDMVQASAKMKTQARLVRRDALGYMLYLMSAKRYFQDLPQPIATTKTDADGNFTIDVPQNRTVAIGAAATREIFSKTESYHWLVPVPTPLPAKLMLSNDNMVSPSNHDSLLQVSDEDGQDVGPADKLVTRTKEICREALTHLSKAKLTPAQQELVRKLTQQSVQ